MVLGRLYYGPLWFELMGAKSLHTLVELGPAHNVVAEHRDVQS